MVRIIFYKTVSSKISPSKAQIIVADISYDGKKYTCKGNKNFLGALPPETESPKNIVTAMQLLPRKYTGGYVRAEFIEDKKKGSSESGHHGHSGLPGVWGGSRPSGGTTSGEAGGKPPETDKEKFIDAAMYNRDEYGEYLGGGINETILVNYEDDGQGVWKRLSGRLHDGHAEIIVSEVDNMLGLDVVPPTVYSEFEGVFGTSQMYIEAARTGRKLSPGERHGILDGSHPDGETIAFLDYIVGNPDRHWGNWLLGDNGKLYAIDNGLCSFGRGVGTRYRAEELLPQVSRKAREHTFSASLMSKLKQVVGEEREGARQLSDPKRQAYRKSFPRPLLHQRGDAIQSVWNRMVDIVEAEGTVKW